MPYDPDGHHRRSVRLPEYDYTRPGAYFVTICTHQRKCLFGNVVDGAARLNRFGEIAQEEWFRSTEIRREIELHPDEFVVMPNHIHGIVWIVENCGKKQTVGATGRSPLLRPIAPTHAPRGPIPYSLGAFVAGFKSAVTKRVNEMRGTPGVPLWQRNYYEHVVRTERALNAIRQYIADNPARWTLDRYHPNPTGRDPRAAELWRLLREEP